ncbi:hypothetical protein CCZ01_05245 [Helicobacter monodelphidis]|uniref:ABC transporter substrate-binding protein n=1 Tax=Helicobacter sp. 15-1451 TaxID=2004995 RepID=UPI000DCEF585|nr:ABC transporter substrate-binding protein [Helicobacter sp. 15-1451]RAX57694.1 hypothetical protein CCZ01_05245 [Helicobacter sp. 15-1451]
MLEKLLKILCVCMGLFSFAFAQAPKMIVLDPAIVEILYALKAEDRILAIAKMQAPIKPADKTSKLPVVGTFSHPSIEDILRLKPDYVILNSYAMGIKPQLDNFNIKNLSFEAHSLEQIKNNILEIGKIVGKNQEAQKIVGKFETDIQELKKDSLGLQGAFIYSTAPLMLFGGDTLPSDILELLGIQNIAKEVHGKRPIIEQEFLLKNPPQILFYGVRVDSESGLLNSLPLLKNTEAFTHKRLFYMQLHSLLRGSPNIIDEIKQLKEEIKKKI